MSSPQKLRPLTGPAVWQRSDVADIAWNSYLTEEQRIEIVLATRQARDRGFTVDTIERRHVALPSLNATIQSWLRDLLGGRGFVVIRGFPVDLLEQDEISLAYLALGIHLGMPVHQNRMGELLTPISSQSPDNDTDCLRLFKSRQAMDFHTDGADLVGLLCVRPGARGGASRLVSSGAVYNRMLKIDLSLLANLYEPVPWDQHVSDLEEASPWEYYAPIALVDGAPRIDYIGWDIRDAQRHLGVPRLTENQSAAIRLLEETIHLADFQVEMTLDAGDIQFINDRLLLHARDAFEDHPPPGSGRKLLRLWLGHA